MEILRSEDPFSLFRKWMDEAARTEPADPEAMALATANAAGHPSVRMVLLKEYGPGGFVFYTNTESNKGLQIAENPFAALCLHWKSLNRQIRAEGRVERVGEGLADAYFATRHPSSRLGAWASRQSRPLESRAALEAAVETARERFEGQTIPRPPHWGGYRLVPDSIEFWQEGAARLHDRFLFTRAGDGWDLTRLNP